MFDIQTQQTEAFEYTVRASRLAPPPGFALKMNAMSCALSAFTSLFRAV